MRSRISESIDAARIRTINRADHARLKETLVKAAKRYAGSFPGDQAEIDAAERVRAVGMILIAFEEEHPELVEE